MKRNKTICDKASPEKKFKLKRSHTKAAFRNDFLAEKFKQFDHHKAINDIQERKKLEEKI